MSIAIAFSVCLSTGLNYISMDKGWIFPLFPPFVMLRAKEVVPRNEDEGICMCLSLFTRTPISTGLR